MEITDWCVVVTFILAVLPPYHGPSFYICITAFVVAVIIKIVEVTRGKGEKVY